MRRRCHRTVVREIEAAAPFCRAEDYHQRSLEKRALASCTPRLAAAV